MNFLRSPFGISLFIFCCSILLKIGLGIMNSKGVYLHLNNGIGQDEVSITLSIVLLISGLVAVFSKVNDKGIRIIVISFSSIFLLFIFLNWWALDSDVKYFNFSSPDGKERFVVIESRYSKIYQLSESKIFMEHLVNIKGDDGLRMFTNNMYKLHWGSPNTLTIYYADDYMHPNKYEKISIQYDNY